MHTLPRVIATVVLGLGIAAPTAVDGPRVASAMPAHAAEKSPQCGGKRPMSPTGGRYACTFTANFGGTALDSRKWIVQETRLSGVTTGNRDCYVDSPNNISVSDGAVHLTSRFEARAFLCRGPGVRFFTRTTAATIATRTHFSQTYGRFAFRARFPSAAAQGVHSALWLYPAKHRYGPWPHSGEIDVAEWFSSVLDHVYPSLHYEGEPASGSSGTECTVTDPWRYHRYAVEWTNTLLRFLYDGQECFRYSWAPAAPLVTPQPFDKPFYVVLTQVFGAGSNAVTSATPRVATMDVDWVRAWK